jgi:flagellar protein FlgJ
MRVNEGSGRTGANPKEAPEANAKTPDAQGTDSKASEAQRVAVEFETLFLDIIMKGMRQTAKPEDQSNAQDIFTGMLDQEYAKNMTASRDFGVRGMILDWMKTADPGLGLGEAARNAAKLKAAGPALDAYRMQSAPLTPKR